MVMLKTARTLVRTGRYDENLESVIEKSHERFEKVSVGLGNTVKYAFFNEDESYLLIVSQQKDRATTQEGYNVIFTATSYSDDKDNERAKRFEQETEISLNGLVTEQLKNHFQIINRSFAVFEKHGYRAMDILR